MAFPRIPDSNRNKMRELGLENAHQYLSQDLPKYINGVFHPDNSVRPAEVADADANNHAIYYSTDFDRLVYKDKSGVVHFLY